MPRTTCDDQEIINEIIVKMFLGRHYTTTNSNKLFLCFLISIGAPIYYSSPHFLYGTESLFEGVIGPEPVEEEHKVFFDIEMVCNININT